MTTALNIILRIIHYLSIVCTILFTIFSSYKQTVGVEKAEELLRNLHLPINYDQALIIGFIFVGVACITFTFISISKKN